MSRVARAREIVASIEAALLAEGVTDVLVTIDSRKVEKALFHGPVVVVQPPTIDFSTFTIMDLTWDMYVVSGPTDDAVAAWERSDEVIDALELNYVPLTRGEPANFQARGATYPAYILSMKETVQVTRD